MANLEKTMATAKTPAKKTTAATKTVAKTDKTFLDAVAAKKAPAKKAAPLTAAAKTPAKKVTAPKEVTLRLSYTKKGQTLIAEKKVLSSDITATVTKTRIVSLAKEQGTDASVVTLTAPGLYNVGGALTNSHAAAIQVFNALEVFGWTVSGKADFVKAFWKK